MRTPFATVSVIVACLFTIVVPTTAAQMMGHYFPLNPGATWVYENADDPLDTFTESVFDVIEYEGKPAYRLGRDFDNHTIVHLHRGVITVYAEVVGGVLIDLEEDVVLDEVIDGDHFRVCFETPCDTSLVRIWDNLDHALRSIYGMSPALYDMVVIASYDSDYPPNFHNTVMESNLPVGVTPPAGAVTGLEFYWRDVGEVDIRDIDAATGGQVEHYVLVAATGVDDGPPSAGGIILDHVAPNPFNPRTTVHFHLAGPTVVTTTIHDCAGRLVRTLETDRLRTGGSQTVTWDGVDARGRAVPSGTYLCRISGASGVVQAKLCLVR